MRPKKLIGVLGTHTEVGKTYVSAKWLSHLRSRGLRVAARKPVQSYAPDETNTDSARLAEATGEDPLEICPIHESYPRALAPPMAADLLSRPSILLRELLDEIQWPENVDLGLIETVGGPRSPLSHDADSVELLEAFEVDGIVLVADAGLGTLSAVRMSIASIGACETIAYLNRYDEDNELHRLNRSWLEKRFSIQTAVSVDELSTAFSLTEASY